MRFALLLLFASAAAGDVLVRESLTGTHVREAAVPRCIVWRGPLQPFDCHGVPLYFNAGQPARVFDPNPVAAINDPSLMDQNDSPAAVPDRAYAPATVDLLSPHVTIVDRQPPATEPPDAGQPLVFDRGDDRFEPVNAVFHIDRFQRYLQSLGYAGRRQLVRYAVPVDALAFSGVDGSFFLPSFAQPGYGALFYGSGGTDDAEDADLVIHEYVHAVLEWIAPGTFGSTFASEARALSEGIADYLAFSAHHEQRVRSGRDPFCFADWDARCWTDAPSENCVYPPGSDCLRRLDSRRTMADYEYGDVGGVEHRNGQIWSAALAGLFAALGRRTTDTLVIESLFDVPPHPTFAVMARRLIETDRLLHGGVNGAAICAVMQARGIAVVCDAMPRGEWTQLPGGDAGLPIPELNPDGVVSRIEVRDSRTIERVAVRVDIDHSARGDLRIELVAPDGTRVLLQNPSFELARDIHVTFGIDAAPAQTLEVLRGRQSGGTWELHVSDRRARDTGTLQSWSLLFQYRGDEPLAVRPRSEKRQMIPVVSHLFGVEMREYRSDVRLSNATAQPQNAMLIFTRSGTHDGHAAFGAIEVRLQPGQTAAFEDIVARTFLTTGSGSLEVLGDVVVMSRSYWRTAEGGTVGTQVPPNLESASAADPTLFAAALPIAGSRYNLGVTEIGGASGRVEIDAGGRKTAYDIGPFSHFQIPGAALAGIRVIEGEARVVAYVSQIEASSEDPMFVPALQARARSVIAPAISARGANARWQTDLWLTVPLPAFPFIIGLDYVSGGLSQENPALDSVQLDAVGASWNRPGTAGVIVFGSSGEMVPHSRITNGRTSQYVPFAAPTAMDQHLLFVENDSRYRTNLGLAAQTPAVAEVVVFDSAGRELERHVLATPGGMAQIPLSGRVTNGRAQVRFLQGEGGRAYGSLIDLVSGDATFVPGQ